VIFDLKGPLLEGSTMPSPLKFYAPVRLDLELRELARRSGRTLSDEILRTVERGLLSASALPDDTAIVDVAERNGYGGKAVAAYLSKPLSSAIERLAEREKRSVSWTMRDLIRCELRRRGILTTPLGHADA
jgi:hypothetical protein